MNTFGDVLKALRQIEDLTLDHCAKKIDSHKGYWSGIENHKVNPPSVGVTRNIAKLFAGTLKKLGVDATVEDWIELAWACKSPAPIRSRAMHRVRGNPLARMEIKFTAAKPAVVTPGTPSRTDLKPTAPLPEDADLLPGEKAAG